MTVSRATADQIVRTIQRHIPEKSIRPLIAELREIPGNKSFRDTVELLDELYNGRADLGNTRR